MLVTYKQKSFFFANKTLLYIKLSTQMNLEAIEIWDSLASPIAEI